MKDAKGWFLMLGLLGGEWSSQFCADPKKVDDWRIRTRRNMLKRVTRWGGG